MSDVIEFAPRVPSAKPKAASGPSALVRKIEHFKQLEAAFGEDAHYLRRVTEWHVSRAKAEIAWAQSDYDGGFGAIRDTQRPDMRHYNRMRDAEELLARAEPRTTKCAAELLGLCVEILAKGEADPGHTLAAGPLLDIIRNVKEALEWPAGTTRLRKADKAD